MVSLNRDALNEKVLEGARISSDEAIQLYQLPLEELGALADVRRNLAKGKSYGGRGREIVTYIADRNINYTNVCNVYCKFCAFYRTERDDDHYVLSLEQIDQKLDELSAAGGVQILMQGGHHPKLPFQWYVDLLQHIRKKYPHINIHGFSPPEFQHFAETFQMPLRNVISEFKSAGLGSIPGGGGEILVDRVRKKISPLKINSDQWLEVMQVAHELGLKSSATMMFGHVETIEERIEHLRSAGPKRRVHRLYLLDVSAAAHRFESEATDQRGRVFKNAGAVPHFFRQHRQHPEFMGHPGTGDRPGGVEIWRQRFRFGHDGGKCGQRGRDDVSFGRREN
jgi:cyclic dehypoxanthinyl futalosine synthase